MNQNELNMIVKISINGECSLYTVTEHSVLFIHNLSKSMKYGLSFSMTMFHK